MAPGEAIQSSVEEDTDKEECAWCKFMKAGPCRAVFEVWQSCIDNVLEAPDDAAAAAGSESNRAAVEQCAGVTGPLFECMGKHRHYYGAQLDGMDSRKQEVQQQVQQQAAPQGADAAGAGSNSPGGSSSGSGSGGGNSSDGDGTAGSHSLQASNSSADTAKGGTGGAARGSEQLGDAAAAGRGMAAL